MLVLGSYFSGLVVREKFSQKNGEIERSRIESMQKPAFLKIFK